MKYLFFLLIVFNIVFYLWETGVGHPARPEGRAKAAEAGERIVLVKELPKPPAPASEPAGQAVPLESSSPPPGQAGAQPAVPPAESVPAFEPPASLRTQDPSPMQAPPPACYRLGPYASAKQAQAAVRKLGAGAGQPGVVKKPVEVEKGYLILYPAAESLEAAQANRKMLVAKGVKEAWVIDKGDNRYAVSLAAVGNKERASEALSRFLAQGIQAELKPRLGPADRWWVEAREEAGRSALEAVAGASAGQGDEVAVKACD